MLLHAALAGDTLIRCDGGKVVAVDKAGKGKPIWQYAVEGTASGIAVAGGVHDAWEKFDKLIEKGNAANPDPDWEAQQAARREKEKAIWPNNILIWSFAGFHVARVAVEKSCARVPAIRREPLRRGPDAKIVCMTASSRTAASFAANGRADRGRRNVRVHTSTHVTIANASAA